MNLRRKSPMVMATTRVERFSVAVKSDFRVQPQPHLRGLSPRTVFYTKLHYYYHTNKERLPFGFMKLSNNGHVGLEVEMLLHFLQFVSGTKFMSKLRSGDTDWECELLFFSLCLRRTQCSWGTRCDCSSILLLKGSRACVGTALLFLIWCTFL